MNKSPVLKSRIFESDHSNKVRESTRDGNHVSKQIQRVSNVQEQLAVASRSAHRVSRVKKVISNTSNAIGRPSSALMSVQNYIQQHADVRHRASVNLGVPNPSQLESRAHAPEGEGQATYQSHIEEMGNLRIENERLKTTVMILN
jgi:hypothetical protein